MYQVAQICRCLVVMGVVAMWPAVTVWAIPIRMTKLVSGVNAPIGIDYYAPNNTLVASVNYPSGFPSNFVEVTQSGAVSPFSSISGLTDEVKIATVWPGTPGGFSVGDFFTGNGIDGQIVRVTGGGTTVINPWVDLPESNNGLIRGSLHVDRTGVYGGDLIVVTTAGQVWRVDAAANATKLADVGVHLEGVLTVPDDWATYGPLAGKILAGSETEGLIYAFDANGLVDTFAPGVNVEDIDFIEAGYNFFGANFGTNAIFGAEAAEFAPYAGDILLTQETHPGSTGLFRLYWNGTSLVTEAVTLAPGSDTPGQWEHVTFAPAGLDVITATVPEPAGAAHWALFVCATALTCLCRAARPMHA